MAYIISGIGATEGHVESHSKEAAVITDTRQRLAPPIAQLLNSRID